MSSFGVLFPIIFPMMGSIIFAIMKFKNEFQRNVYLISVIVLNFIAVILIAGNSAHLSLHIWTINDFLDIYFKIDSMGALFSLLSGFLWIFTTFYSIDYMKHEGGEKKFFVYFLFTLGITTGIAFSGNLFTLYIFYELLTLATYPLVIHSGTKEALESGKKYLAYSFAGATMVLAGMLLLFGVSSNMDFKVGGVLDAQVLSQSQLISIAYILMFLGFGVKVAMVPFHSWLPGAMVAPTPVSSLLHAVAVVKSGIFSIIRLTFFIVGANIILITHDNIYLSILIGLTILLGSLLALHQDNLKKRLAYSTISQLGYILLGIVLLNENGLIGGILHLVNHAVIKITMFFCAGAIMYTSGKKNISEIAGIGKRMPITMWCFGIASISLIGLPPTNGFVSKWYLALGGLDSNRALFVVILLASALLTASYLIPIITRAFFGKEEIQMEAPAVNSHNEHAGDRTHDIHGVITDPPFKMLMPIVVLTGINIFLGIFPNILIDFIKNIVGDVI